MKTLLLTLLGLGLHAAEPPKPSLSIQVEADYLALHLQGKVSPATSTLQYRLAEVGDLADDAPWVPLGTSVSAEGSFARDLPLPASRWSVIQVRALQGDQVLSTKTSRHRADAFTLLTDERLRALPAESQTAWKTYLQKSQARREKEFDLLAAECRKLGLAASRPAPGGKAELEIDTDTPTASFATDAYRHLAESIISYQTPSGGWSKAIDYSQGPRQPGTHWTSQKGDAWHYCGTIDNRTTTEQIKLLAAVHAATGHAGALAAAQRGLDYLFEAQFPNGGWPQNYPIESGYHEAITLNDNAMVHVLEVLLLITQKKAMFVSADDELLSRAQAAFDRGIACLAAAQVKIEGKPTVWCAQHDPLSLVPVKARAKEPPSLSGAESAEFIRFFMRKAPITPQTLQMIDTALAWFDTHRVTGLRKTRNDKGRTDYVPDPGSTEVYWARFYDIATGRPIFAGAEDGIIYPTFTEMAAHNRVAYDFYTTKPAELLTKERARWKKRLASR